MYPWAHTLAVALAFIIRAGRCTSPQDEILQPALPQLSANLTIGTNYTIQWTERLSDWFPAYGKDVDVTNTDIWVEDFYQHTRYRQVARGVNVRSAGSVSWIVALDPEQLVATNSWIFSFVRAGSTAGAWKYPQYTNLSIQSAGFWIYNTSTPTLDTNTITTTSSTTASTSTANPASSTTSSSSSTATNNAAPAPASSGLSTGAKAGIAVGAVLGAIVLIVCIWCLMKRRRKSTHVSELGAKPYGSSEKPNLYDAYSEVPAGHIPQRTGRSNVRYQSQVTHEMPGKSRPAQPAELS